MAEAARDLGHDYLVLTDHSPRLTVANGLSPERLLAQLDEVALLNEELRPFRILTGIEVDILEDGALDQTDELLGRLDVVVASVHSKLRMPAREMTRRMVAAVANPHTDILGHCTGRMVAGRGRPESEFDPGAVFAACAPTGSRSRSTPGPSARTRPSACSAWPSRPAAGSRSTPTPTPPASSTGSSAAASAPSPAASPPSWWSTPATPRACSPGPPATAAS
jgi:putative hydrolase